jgi:hypothetical protein
LHSRFNKVRNEDVFFFVAEEIIGLLIIGFYELAELGIDPLCAKEELAFRSKDSFVEKEELKSMGADGL